MGVQDDNKKSARGLYEVRLLQLGRKSAVRGLKTGDYRRPAREIEPKTAKTSPHVSHEARKGEKPQELANQGSKVPV